METLKLAFLAYLLVACTFGAYRLADIDATRRGENLSLFHIIIAVPRAIMFDWFLTLAYFTSKFKK